MTSSLELTAGELEAMVAAIPDLLANDRLYLSIEMPGPHGTRIGRASLGGSLRRLAELEAAGDASLRDRVRRARQEVDAVRARSAERWSSKIAKELGSLADAYQYFVVGLERQDPRVREDYALEIRPRLDAARLRERAGDSPQFAAVDARLADLDERLRVFFEPADSPDRQPVLSDGFPLDRARHWWAFGKVPAPEERADR